MIDRFVSHAMAAALLSAPLVLGSLQLFFNPTGLVRSIQRGVSDMIDLPLQGLQKRSALKFFAGIGQGSASLVKEISGWGISSVVGFSRAASNAITGSRLLSSLGSRSNDHIYCHRELLPIRRHRMLCGARLVACLGPNFEDYGKVIFFSPVQEVAVRQNASNSRHFRLNFPVVIVTTSSLILYGDGGLTPSFVAWLAGASISHSRHGDSGTIEIVSRRAAPFNSLDSVWHATVHVNCLLLSYSAILSCLLRVVHEA